MAEISLITGGCRSGKSAYAEEYVGAMTGAKFYLATSPYIDGEMNERISKHQARRGKEDWTTIEESCDLAGVFGHARAGENYLVECVSMWINNLLYFREDFSEADLDLELARLFEVLTQFAGSVIFVTNEIGMGIIPENALSRRYCDLIGRVNRRIASRASRVVFVVAGIPLVIKG